MTKKIKAILSLGTFGLTGTAFVPLVQHYTNDSKETVDTTPIDVMIDGIEFSNKEELITYIKENVVIEQHAEGTKAFSMNFSGSEIMFANPADALNYIEDYHVSYEDVYLKNDWENYFDNITKEISGQSYYNADDSLFMDTFKKSDGSYTIANVGNELETEKAMTAASSSYLNMHNAYYFNGYYFDNKATLKKYLKEDYADEHISGNISSSSTAIVTQTGETYYFDDKDDPTLDAWIKRNAIPYIQTTAGPVELNSENVADIALGSTNELFEYITINSNDGETTEIVDMDNSTENGNFYGPYFIKSGTTMIDVGDSDLWQKHKYDSNLSTIDNSSMELISTNMSILSNDINGEFKGLADLLREIELDGENIFDVLGSFSTDLIEFIDEIERGSRAMLFNTLAATFTYGVNSMIQNNEPHEKIIKFSDFMDAFTQKLDFNLFVKYIDYFKNLNIERDELQYFRKIFNFKELQFQRNLYSYEAVTQTDPMLKLITTILKIETTFSSTKIYDTNKNNLIVSNWVPKTKWEKKVDPDNPEEEIRVRVIDHDIRPNFNYTKLDFDTMDEIIKLNNVSDGFGNNEKIIIQNIKDKINEYNFLANSYYRKILNQNTTSWETNTYTNDFYPEMSVELAESNSDMKKHLDEVSTVRQKYLTETGSEMIRILEHDEKFGEDFWNDYQSLIIGNVIDFTLMATKFIYNIYDIWNDYKGTVKTLLKTQFVIVMLVADFIISLLPEADFSGERTSVYEFSNKEDPGKNLYWDGGLETWTFWGLSRTTKFDIHDLKMIPTREIISSYAHDFYYANFKLYDDLSSLKYEQSNDLVETISDFNRDDFMYEQQNGITWGIETADSSTNGFTTLSALITHVKNNLSKMSKEAFQTGEGLVTDQNVVVETAIENLITTLNPVLIVQEPDINFKGEYVITDFKYPSPSITVDGRNESPLSDEDNLRLHIINRTIDKTALQNQNNLSQASKDALLELSSKPEIQVINDIFNSYAKRIIVKTKRVLFDEINNQGEWINFDALNDVLIPARVWKTTNSLGRIRTFLHKNIAVDALLDKDNMNFQVRVSERLFIQYRFNEYVSSTFDALIDEIIKKEGNND